MRTLLVVLVGTLLSACSLKVTRPEVVEDDLVAKMPWTPGTEEAVREWIDANANDSDLSIDLGGPAPYVETALGATSPIPRVGFFFDRDPWRVAAVLFWLAPLEKTPELGAQAGQLWGMPLFATARANELYAPAAHVLVHRVDPAFVLPVQPAVDLPEDIPIKTPTRTFNRDHLYAVVDGRIWFKRNPSRGGYRGEPWRLFGDGLPAPRSLRAPFARPARIVAVNADGDDLLALADDGRIFLCTTESESVSSENGWEDGWGFPGKRPLFLAGRAADPRALSIGRRAEHALWFEDAIGNRHHFGPMGTTTLYVLNHEGSELLFTDNGLPNDFSRDLCPPDDGRFVAENLSASASAIFAIDRYGRMATRFEDYDLNGGTPNFEYTYRSEVRPEDQGDSFLTSMSPYYLPLPPWRWQPPPVLERQGRISREVTVLQTGAGNAARELRVAGLNASGEPGYYRKGIDEDAWVFVPSSDVVIDPNRLLDPIEVERGAEEYQRTRGVFADSLLPKGRNYRGTWTGSLALLHEGHPEEALNDLSVTMDWNPYCSPASLTFASQGVSFRVPLHTVDLWTPMQRKRPGFDGTPLMLLGTMVIDDSVLTDPRPQVRRVVEHLRWYHQSLFGLLVVMQGDRAEITAIDDGPGHVHPLAMSFRRTGAWDPPEPAEQGLTAPQGSVAWLSGNLKELAAAPELVVDAATSPLPALRQALAENLRLREELRAAVKAQEEQLAAVEEFKQSIRFAAPLLPLGRFRILPKLLSLQSVRGRLVLVQAKETWKSVDDQLSARIELYQTELGRRSSGDSRRGGGDELGSRP